MKIGYARISTQDQNFNLQIDALKNEGCEKIIRDTMSGAKEERRGLKELFKILRKGDTLVVWRLDGIVISSKAADRLSSEHLRENVVQLNKNSAVSMDRYVAYSGSEHLKIMRGNGRFWMRDIS